MDLADVIKKGNTLKGILYVKNNNLSTKYSPEFVINGSTVFQVKLIKVLLTVEYGQNENSFIYVRFTKHRPEDEFTYTATIWSDELSIVDKQFTSDDGEWHLLKELPYRINRFDMSVRKELLPSPNSFASLYDDTELTDFELRGSDGAVCVHRAVLATVSPVLRRMLGGAWRETVEGYVDVPGTTSATLQHFKKYVYLHTLPESGIEQLLLLSSYYMMPELKQKCSDKLLDNVNATNLWDMIEFATKHKLMRLLLGILECVQSGSIVVNDLDAGD